MKKIFQYFQKYQKAKNFKIVIAIASRWGNISDFKNFDLITPNELGQDLL